MGILPYQSEPLFFERRLSELLHMQQLKVEQKPEDFTSDEILIIPVEDLVDRVHEEFFIEPLIIHRDKAQSSEPVEVNHYSAEHKRYIFRGFGYELIVPFSGAQGLFRHKPERHDLEPPYAFVNEGGVQIRIVADVDSDLIKAEMTKQMDAIDRYIAYQAIQLNVFNATIRDSARRLIEDRKARILGAKHVAASLGFPMNRRDGAPATYISPVVRKKIVPVAVPAQGGFTPEPTIDEGEYQNILRILESMTFVLERNPKVFSTAPEETIRDHYLVQLNAQYEGGATGETFNANGKTDILVRDGSTNLFVAECKIWHGESEFIAAIKQLFTYLTWRDSKAAIIIFSHNKNTSGVIETIKSALVGHENHKCGPQHEGETRLRSVFGRPDDPNREIIVTVMVAPIPKAVTVKS